MNTKKLHIVSFDNPFPPVYGGVIDVFYKIKALHEIGLEIFLHCIVDDDVAPSEELIAITNTVMFYKRNKSANALKLLSQKPFAAVSRYNSDLVKNLEMNNFPILFEGLQSTYLLQKHNFSNRKLYLRLHNIESNYFAGSYKSERNPIKKVLYGLEARKYEKYQQIIERFDAVFTLSISETEFVQSQFQNASYVPVFHGNSEPKKLSEFGDYAFYHGDLRLPDNKRAVGFLIDIFAAIPNVNFVIASGLKTEEIALQISDYPNIKYCEFEKQEELDVLLENAHVNVMMSFQESGTKLKLVNALYKSRFCLVNKNMADDPKLLDLCTIAETKSEFTESVQALTKLPYRDCENRKVALESILNDVENATKIAEIIG